MKLIQKAIIRKNGKVLVALRARSARMFSEHWDFPGGKLEPDEELLKGIIREVKEETNLDIKPLKVIATYDFDFETKGETTHRFLIYSTELLSDDIRISKEHTEFRWLTSKEIQKLQAEPYIVLLAKDGFI